MVHRKLLVALGLVVFVVGILLVTAEPALAGPPDPVKTAKRADMETLGNLLLLSVAVVFLGLGLGAGTATLRVVLPGVADRADASVRRLGFVRLLLTGVLPLIGTALIGMAVEKAHSQAVETAFIILVVIPLFLALIAGAMAALPHLGARLLKDGDEAGVLRQALVGGGVIGLAGTTWVVPPLGGFLSFVVLGWLVGAGMGTVFPAHAAPPKPEPSA